MTWCLFITADGGQFWHDVQSDRDRYVFPKRTESRLAWELEEATFIRMEAWHYEPHRARFCWQEEDYQGRMKVRDLVEWTVYYEAGITPPENPEEWPAWSIVARNRRCPEEAHHVHPAPRLVRETA